MTAGSRAARGIRRRLNAFCLCTGSVLLAVSAGAARAQPLTVVAAENFYGDIARQIGGDNVSVTSILASPGQDPHLFELSASVARDVSRAGLVIENGLGYDAWMDRLVQAARLRPRRVIVVASLLRRRAGDNPHLWFDPAAMPALAHALCAGYSESDPAHAADYAQRLARFSAAMAPVAAKIALLRQKLQGAEVMATEPVFGYMIAALGMVSHDQRFQLAVMNETEASASDVAAFEDGLRSRRVRLLIVNRQASSAVADRMKSVALAAGVPVVSASETEPAGLSYQAWMLAELGALEAALDSPKASRRLE